VSGSWGVVAGIVGSILGAVALLGSGLFAARATKAAALTTAEAQRTAANVAAEPAQRAQDLAAFKEINTGLERRIEKQERRIESFASLVRAFSWYVGELTAQMRGHGIEPPAPPQRVDEYNRTGV